MSPSASSSRDPAGGIVPLSVSAYRIWCSRILSYLAFGSPITIWAPANCNEVALMSRPISEFSTSFRWKRAAFLSSGVMGVGEPRLALRLVEPRRQQRPAAACRVEYPHVHQGLGIAGAGRFEC